jgi:hypothetical protein
MAELRDEDVPAFRNFVRMEPAMFNEVVQRITPRIEKLKTNYREACCNSPLPSYRKKLQQFDV